GKLATFLGSAVDMDRFIDEVVSCIDASKAKLRSNHQVNISFDEWNVWYQGSEPSKVPEGLNNWPVAPHLLEDIYTVTDAVVVGDFLITLLKHADRVKAASIAQLVNVIGLIMAPAHAPAYRQTTFYPFAETASLTKNGRVLTEVFDFPKLENEKYGTIDVIDSVSVYCANNSLAIFIVNRSTDEDINYKIALPADHKYSEIVKAQTLHDDNFYAQNTAENNSRVILNDNDSIKLDLQQKKLKINLPRNSWTVINIK
ncbi:MAG: hypothetical protein M3Z48_07825, partial [Lactobacillus sp.]|nr:hypothetical protein [Lactobacillus sp.]